MRQSISGTKLIATEVHGQEERERERERANSIKKETSPSIILKHYLQGIEAPVVHSCSQPAKKYGIRGG